MAASGIAFVPRKFVIDRLAADGKQIADVTVEPIQIVPQQRSVQFDFDVAGCTKAPVVRLADLL
jgi:hypothetical protein